MLVYYSYGYCWTSIVVDLFVIVNIVVAAIAIIIMILLYRLTLLLLFSWSGGDLKQHENQYIHVK